MSRSKKNRVGGALHPRGNYAKARAANDQLASEVDDLKSGLGIVEEKARMELGMVRPNEIFVQVNRAPTASKGQ